MDWDLKVPSWDLAEFDRATTEQNLSSVVAVPSGGSALQCPASGLECSVDLKLGGVSDSGSSYKWKEQPGTSSTTMVPSSGPSKRQRALSNANQCALCLVEGCKADLSKCREYHRRHKVCEVHSKTPVVMVGGQEQRFCQQCSRFHLLVEFDEVKRSCRKRLDRHNRRRRKPQPHSLNSGNRFLAYPQVFPTTTAERNWAGIVKTEDNAGYTHCTVPDLLFFSNSSQSYSKERKQFPFLQESETSLGSITTVGSLVGQTHLMPSTLSGVGSSNNMISNGQTQVFHSDCALSLLSLPTQTPAISLSHRISSADRIPMGQPLVPSSQYADLARYSCSASENVSPTGYSCLVMGDNHASAVLVSDANDADIHCQSVFHIGGEGSSDGTPQALPFTWQ